MAQKRDTILIVDDNPNNLKVLAGVLKAENYDFRMAKSGQMALNILEKTSPDLILLDIQMPGMDGFETCRKIKEEEAYAKIPVVYLTANTDSESIKNAFNSGGVDYVTKPFNSDELLARIKTHIKLKKQSEELEFQNASKDKFFSIISHDLISPIGGVLNFSSILKEDYKTLDLEKIGKFASIINDSAGFTLDLLKNLLEWSRIQTGRLTPNKSLFNLSKILVQNINGHSTQSSLKNIKITQDIDDNLMVEADEKMISTVVRNLLSNGIKFTPNGGEIKVSSHEKSIGDKNVIETSIQDSGIGIENEKIQNLFKIQNNYKSKGTNNESGTGLGLVLCEEFLSNNNGTIKVESELNKGSTFSFTLESLN